MPDPGTRSITTDFGLLLIRLVLATVFLFHGSQKLFGAFDGPGIEGFTKVLEGMDVPMPSVSAWLAGLSEFVGGVFLVLGTGMRIAIIPTIITMFVAVIKVHSSAFSAQHNGMEYPLTLGVVLIGLLLTGPGRITIGGLRGGGGPRE